MQAVIKKIATCGQDLDIENRFVLVLPFHFAQIGCLAVDQEVLEQVLPVAAPDLDLQVATAGRPPAVIRGPTRCLRARIGVGHHGMERQGSSGRWGGWQVTADQLAAVDQLKMIAPELSGLLSPGRYRYHPLEAVCLATRTPIRPFLQMTTGNVHAGIRPQFLTLYMQRSELDPLGVAKEPGTVVVFLTLEHGHAKLDVEGAALPT